MGKPITIVIAEDNFLIRMGLRALFNMTRDIQVAGEAVDGFEALSLVEENRPDVLVLDIHIPILDGIQVIEQLHQAGSSVHILVHTGESDPVYRQSLYELDVAGVMIKGGNPEALIDAVRIAAQGGMVGPSMDKAMEGRWIPSASTRSNV